MLRAVVFDLDGTLLDHHTAAATAVAAWAADHGVRGPDVVGRWAAIAETHYSRYQLRELTFAEQRRERVREFLSVDVDDPCADELFAGYSRRYEAALSPFFDAITALRRARAAGLVVSVLTNGDEGHQRLKVERLGLAQEIDSLVASSSLPAGKPDARAFEHAVALIGVGCSEALMVGDSLENDVRGALAAGLAAVLLDRDDTHAGVDVRRVRSLDDLTFDSSGPRAGTLDAPPRTGRLSPWASPGAAG